MTNEFTREDRYIVFKMPDLGNSLKGDEIRRLALEYAEHLEQLVKKPLDYVVVGVGWSEYGPALRAIEVHVTGAQPAPTIAEQDQINAEAAIRSIYGARPNDEALWQTIVNGMITPAHTAQAVADGPITPAHTMQLAPSIPEGVSFIDTSQLTGVVSTEIVHSYPPPSGWLRAIDEALVVTPLGVANAGDTYEQAKAKLDSLIGFHVDVATDPAVNGGWKLMPVEPTEEVYQCFSAYDGTSYSNPFDRDEFLKDWRAALAAAPEAKP